MVSDTQSAYLIVNADDYCYFDCVSRGILQAARKGIVTATGIFANSAYFSEHVGWLADYSDLDLGVHLNLSDGEPLTKAMRRKLSRSAGHFSGKYAIVKAVLAEAVTREDVKGEWRTQIERCLDNGLEVRFLNSHEHIHMLPPLFSALQVLANEYAIPHIRFSKPEALKVWSPGALTRDTAMMLLASYNRRRARSPMASFLGMGVSGRLDGQYLEWKLRKLKPGRVYELMCHPGQCDRNEVHSRRLLAYHDWTGELASLTNPSVQEILRRNRVKLIGYRHLQIQAGQLVVRQRAPGD